MQAPITPRKHANNAVEISILRMVNTAKTPPPLAPCRPLSYTDLLVVNRRVVRKENQQRLGHYIKNVLPMREEVRGPQHPVLTTSLNNWADGWYPVAPHTGALDPTSSNVEPVPVSKIGLVSCFLQNKRMEL